MYNQKHPNTKRNDKRIKKTHNGSDSKTLSIETI